MDERHDMARIRSILEDGISDQEFRERVAETFGLVIDAIRSCYQGDADFAELKAMSILRHTSRRVRPKKL